MSPNHSDGLIWPCPYLYYGPCLKLKKNENYFFVYWWKPWERILGLEIWIEVEFGASHFSFHVDNRRSKFLKVSEDAFLDRQTSFTSPEFRFRAPNFNLNFKIWRLLFLSNLISGPQNSNSAPSIWSGPNFLHFSSHQNLDFVLGWCHVRAFGSQACF